MESLLYPIQVFTYGLKESTLISFCREKDQIILSTGRMRNVTLYPPPPLSVLYAHKRNSAVLPQARFPFPKGVPSRIQSAVRGYGGSGSDSGPAYRTTINHPPAPGPWTGSRGGTSPLFRLFLLNLNKDSRANVIRSAGRRVR